MDGFWAELRRVGKSLNPYRAAFLQIVGVLPETREEALALYGEPAEYFYRNCLDIDPRFVGPPGSPSAVRRRDFVRDRSSSARLAREGRGKASAVSLATGRGSSGNRHVLVGSPDEVASELRELAVRLTRPISCCCSSSAT